MERIVHDRANSFLTENKIMQKYQLRFLNNHYSNMVFELQEAFNALNSEIIFGLVDAIDLSAKIITWFKFYILD